MLTSADSPPDRSATASTSTAGAPIARSRCSPRPRAPPPPAATRARPKRRAIGASRRSRRARPRSARSPRATSTSSGSRASCSRTTFTRRSSVRAARPPRPFHIPSPPSFLLTFFSLLLYLFLLAVGRSRAVLTKRMPRLRTGHVGPVCADLRRHGLGRAQHVLVLRGGHEPDGQSPSPVARSVAADFGSPPPPRRSRISCATRAA